MADKRDYYEVLGLQKGASDDEIKKAFRRKAKEFHPDLHPGDKQAEANFKEVNEAYEVLSDSQKKARYDQYGHAGVDPNFGAGGGGGFSDMDFDFGDIFSSFFGGGGRRANPNAPRHGGDVAAQVILSFEESAKGCKKQVEVTVVEACADCGGNGAEKGTSPKSCPNCGGSGQVRRQQRTPFGVMQTQAACDRCRGTGRIVEKPCRTCNGSGRVTARRTVGINVPAGIDDGQTIIIRGKGNAGQNGGQPGDLQVRVSVRPHPIFERRGNDIYCDLPLTFVQASLGADIKVPTLDGRETLQVKEGTQPGELLRMKGKGFPDVQGRRAGDLVFRVNVEVPKNLNNEQKELLRKFDSTTSDKQYQKGKSFKDKLKSLFGND
ncbi:MAG: molecular chaperone DnaJ [Clostridia bacterium]|nr:molecular chaperone DnaJ [Clostridia bacterium]